MQATVTSKAPTSGPISHERRLAVLGVLVVACMVSTTAHYTHNYIEIERYPQSDLFSNATVKLGIVIAWPLLTVAGVLGFWLYARRRYVAAYAALALYSLLGITTVGHFIEGSPHIPPFWYGTIFTDFLLGLAIVAFAHWSAVMSPEPGRAPHA